MMALLEENGCPVTVQRGKRVFPASEKASDVTKALTSLLRKENVRIRLNSEVRRLKTENGLVTGAELADGTVLPANAVILACGGLSYPSTGSTGDGYRMARETGHTVTRLLPSLTGLTARESWPAELQGLSLKNVRVTLRNGKKILYTELGEMLFTHFGFSGPLILEASCHLPEEGDGFSLELDLKPGLTREQLDARLRRELEEGGKKQLKNMLHALLPGSMAEIFPRLCGLPEGTACSQVTGPQREKLLESLKHLPLEVKARRPVEEAVITRGGVAVKEVRPGTMESRLVSGLYFAGEILDVDAHTGGYNLQIAFATGALAGESAAAPDAEGMQENE